jgi:hypothetical protein
MPDYEHSNLTLNAVRVPDYSIEMGADGNKQAVELPGHIEFGVELDGVFVPLLRTKYDLVASQVEAGKANQPEPQAPQQAEPVQPQQTGTGTDSTVPGQ